MVPDVRIPKKDLSREVKQLENLLDAMQIAENRLAELLSSENRGAGLFRRPEVEHTATERVQGLLNKIEDMRSGIARLESSLDTLESALASIELLRSGNESS